MTGNGARRNVSADLRGVAETTLWTLYNRARYAARPDTALWDPRAIELVETIDFPFEHRFGLGPVGFDGVIGQRAQTFDREVLQVLAEDPDAIVVALGEGLETQFWRVDNGQVRWFTVDLPETAAVRSRVLGVDPPRRRMYAGSASADGWLRALDPDPRDRVVVVAQGLLMYLAPEEVRDLIARCAARFPGGVMLFDTVPRWFSQLSAWGWARGPGGYTAPPMPWGLDAGGHGALARLHPNIRRAVAVDPERGSGPLAGVAMSVGRRIPIARRALPAIVRLDFGSAVFPASEGS